MADYSYRTCSKKSLFSILVVILFCFIAGGSGKSPEERAERNCTDDVAAFVMSQSFVSQRLRAPSTADFPSFTADGVQVTYLGECTHQVEAFVDAQNGFGGTVRNMYSVKLRYDKSSNQWFAESVSIY